MAAKFFICDGARWREVSLDGRVDGWGSVDFVSARGGRLEVAQRADVLRGLRALLAGKPTTVRDGVPLSRIRVDELKKKRQEEEFWQQEYHCCNLTPLINNKKEICQRMLKSTVSVGVQCGGGLDAATQAGDSAPRRHHHVVDQRPEIPAITNCKKRLREGGEKIEPERKKTKRKRSKSPARPQGAKDTETEYDTGETACKELIIQEEDIALLRRFIERDDGKSFKVDLLKFDEDDDYKRQVFYRLNPIVDLTRSRRVERMLHERRSRTTELSLKDFVTMLGLQSTAERQEKTRRTSKRTRKSVLSSPIVFSDDTDKENAVVKPNQAKKTKVLKENSIAIRNVGVKEKKTDYSKTLISVRSAGASEVVRVNSPISETQNHKIRKSSESSVVRTKKVAVATRGKAREYSRLEDEAIVRHVAGGGRARLVNGNRLWRALQPLHHRLTGQFRSWHSLRNRYLRYLLPQLGAHRSPRTAARLRADAATGELKARKLEPRRNSVFKETRVVSAWGRRPRTPVRSPSSRSSSPKHPPSPPPPGSPQASSSRTPPRTPRPPPVPRLSPYSPRRHSSTSSPSSSDASSASSSESGSASSHRRRSLRRKSGTQVKAARRLRSSDVRTRAATPTYSGITRRFASRTPRPSPPAHPSPPAPSPPPPARAHHAPPLQPAGSDVILNTLLLCATL